MESDLTQDFEQRAGKYPRNVPSGPEESGSQKPFSRPWGDWNLQGTVNTQEEEDVKDVQGQCRSRSMIHHTVGGSILLSGISFQNLWWLNIYMQQLINDFRIVLST